MINDINNDIHSRQGVLLISVKINNDGDLEVTDITPYEEWFSGEPWEIFPGGPIYHQVLERVIYIDNDKDSDVIIYNDIPGASYSDLRNSKVYNIKKDGHYYYQKLILPTENHPRSGQNEWLYYKDGAVYFSDVDQGVSKVLDAKEDFDEIYDLVIGNPLPIDNCYSYDKEFFSMYDLVKCYLLKERARIQDYFKNRCSKACSKLSGESEAEVDILLSAILVLKDLIWKENYYEAQRILDGLQTCGNLCKEFSNNLKGCGCGKN